MERLAPSTALAEAKTKTDFARIQRAIEAAASQVLVGQNTFGPAAASPVKERGWYAVVICAFWRSRAFPHALTKGRR